MKRILTVATLTCLMVLTLDAAERRDRSGGSDSVRGRTTGFFHVEQLLGVWWLITPEGNAFFSKGVNHISYTADNAPALGFSPYARVTAEKYGSALKWAEAVSARLRDWGFNTVGAWSSREMFDVRLPYTIILNLAANAGVNWQKGEVADVFSPQFEQAVRAQAQRLCKPRSNDPFLLGYFSDNELRWSADWRSKRTLLEDFLARASDTPGKQTAIQLIRKDYASIEAFNKAWGTDLKDFDALAQLTELPMSSDAAKAMQREFLREYARRYFKIEYCAEPAEGRFDGENSNYGLVNIQDDPWQTLVERIAQVNGRLEAMHRLAPAIAP